MTSQTRRQLQCNTPHRQSGAVMAVSLILLTALTILGVTALRSSGLHEQMAANLQEKGAAFQIAESAVVQSMSSPADFSTQDKHVYETTSGVTEVELTDSSGEVLANMAYSRCFSVEMDAPRSNNATVAKQYHFDVFGGGETANSKSRSMVHQGVYMERETADNKTLIETGEDSSKNAPCMQYAELDFTD